MGVGVGVGVAEAGVDGVTDQASFPPGGRMRSKSLATIIDPLGPGITINVLSKLLGDNGVFLFFW